MQNIIGIIDKNGKLVVKYDYTAYGQLKSISGDNITLAHANPFRYKGYYYDSDLGMYYCKSRYYNPIWCRWLNADNIENLDFTNINNMNLFAYCGNNPVMYVDPDGNSWESFWSGVGDWFSDNWVKLAIGAGAVALGVLTMGAAALISGAGIVGALSAMGTATISSLVQVGISTAISAGIGFAVGGMTTGSWDGALNGMFNGIADGVMWGGIFAGAGQVLSGAMKITRTLAPEFNGIKIGNLKIWSPNAANNINAGGTLLKFGKFNRIDAEIGNMIHIHLKVFGQTLNHLPIGMILGGILGGF